MSVETTTIRKNRNDNTFVKELADLHSFRSEARIGIICNRLDLSYYGRLLDGICEVLIEHGFAPFVHPSYITTQGELTALKNLTDAGCDGIILLSDSLSDARLEKILNQHTNILLVNRVIEGLESRCIYIDNKLGAEQVARHLLDNGHKNVAMITGPAGQLRDVRARTNAFIEVYSENGYTVPRDLIIDSDFTYWGGFRAFRKLMGTNLPFTAVFAQNDPMAMGVLEVCRQRGIRVPEDLSVVGFDDHHNLLKNSTPRLTTVRQPVEEIGRRAAQLIMEMISEEENSVVRSADYRRVVTELMERETVALLVSQEVRRDARLANILTTREVECLHWIACGKTSGEIAIICSISESTVNYHLKNTLTKLNSSNRVHAVAKAVHNGIINPEVDLTTT